MTYSQADAMMSAGYVVKGFFERVDNRMLGKIAHEAGGEISLMSFLTDLGRLVEEAWVASYVEDAHGGGPWSWWVPCPLGRLVGNYACEAGNLPTIEWVRTTLDDLVTEYWEGGK